MALELESVVETSGLGVVYTAASREAIVLDDVDFRVAEGEIVAVVGESGSGKSTLGLALLGLLPESSVPRVTGSITVAGTSVTTAPTAALNRMRRSKTGLVLQDPTRALDPTMRLDKQLVERGASEETAIRWLASCEVPDPAVRSKQYAFELSGGLAQRVTIAMALAVKDGETSNDSSPQVVVVDEPTTALDPSTQLEILRLFDRLRTEERCAMVLITHDLAAAARIADRILVMYAGRVCESGPVAEVMSNPRHRYTQALLGAQSTTRTLEAMVDIPGHPPSVFDRIDGCAFAARCAFADELCTRERPVATIEGTRAFHCHHPSRGPLSASPVSDRPQEFASVEDVSHRLVIRAEGLTKTYPVASRHDQSRTAVLGPLSLDVRRGESLVIVGESGCGKTTLLRTLAGLIEPSSGSISFGKDENRPQLIHQNFTAALTPWLSIGSQVAERLAARGVPRKSRDDQVAELMEEVGLSPSLASARPMQLSGGQRQRAVIARALASAPAALLCDEPTSALDASYAVRVVRLLNRIKFQKDLGIVVVTHDITLAPHLGDELIVMRKGVIEERGIPSEVVARPKSEYTQKLVSATSAPIRQL